jgi:GntR family transcriptional regulator/MocR family aminotransferase
MTARCTSAPSPIAVRRLRIGYLLLPPQLVAPMTAARTLQDGHNASIAQPTLARFMEGGHFNAHVRAMRGSTPSGAMCWRISFSGTWRLVPQIPAGGLQMPCHFVQALPEDAVVRAARGWGSTCSGWVACMRCRGTMLAC